MNKNYLQIDKIIKRDKFIIRRSLTLFNTLAFLLILVPLTGCIKKIPNSPISRVKQYSELTTNIEVEQRENFVIILDSNPTTGYKWELAEPLNS